MIWCCRGRARPAPAPGQTWTHPIALLAFGASRPRDAQARGTLDTKGHSLEQRHRHLNPGDGCATSPVPPVPRQYSHGRLYLPHRPWGQEVLLALGSLCHPGADEMAPSAPPNHPPSLHCSWGQPGLVARTG